MSPPCWYEFDLDKEVRDAIARCEPNLRRDGEPDTWDLPLLTAVCLRDRLDLAEALFAAGATMSADDRDRIVWWGSTEAVKFLWSHNIPFSTASLRVPCSKREWDSILFLLDQGLDIQTLISIDSPMGHEAQVSLLHIAVNQGQGEAVRRLLERGAEVEALDDKKLTPLMAACDYWNHRHHVWPKILNQLLQAGADPNARNPAGMTPLLFCTSRMFKDTEGRREMTRSLLHFGADPNVLSSQGTTPLMFAARDDDASLAQILIQAGARRDTLTPDGRTALDAAKKQGSKAVLAVLSGGKMEEGINDS